MLPFQPVAFALLVIYAHVLTKLNGYTLEASSCSACAQDAATYGAAALQVRSRAEEIRKSLDDVITTLATRAHVVQWSHVLDKFSVINTQFGALLAALRPMLASYVVHVAGVDSPEALRDLPVLTASSAIPEMAAQAESILAQAVEAAAGAPPNDAAALEVRLLAALVADFQQVIAALRCLLGHQSVVLHLPCCHSGHA